MSIFSVNIFKVVPAVAVMFVLAVAAAAQNRTQPYDTSFRGGISVGVGFVPGQTIRLTMQTPDATSPVNSGGGPRVRVFNGNGGLILEKEFALIQRGGFSYVDISRTEIADTGEERTGRLQVRIEIDYIVRTTGTQPATLPASMELLSEQDGKPVLIGLLLPAVQK
jgi:hypothetical protein